MKLFAHLTLPFLHRKSKERNEIKNTCTYSIIMKDEMRLKEKKTRRRRRTTNEVFRF